MKIPDFTAIDFETATGARNSACSVGFVRYENGQITYKNHFYIQPPNNKYSYYNVMVHGINDKTTTDSPTFDIVWIKIKYLIQNQIVVAHNAAFDKNVLEQSLMFYNIPIPEASWQCTYILTGLSLDNACKMYDIELANHHNALDDALACGNLFLKLSNGYKPNTFVPITTHNKNIFEAHKIDKKYLKPNLGLAKINSPFYNKHVVITGIFNSYSRNEIANILHNEGSFILTQVNKKTDYVLAGANMGPAKKAKAESLGIPIISEEEFEEMIGTK